jgi:hypothetical protein
VTEPDPAESGRAESGRAESGRADSGRADSGRGDSGRGDSGRGDSGRGDSGRGDPGPVTRIAMWSGPRTLSTALMRSFENRSDTVVVDEPLYGFYLVRTGISHPGRDEILASMATEWPEVIEQLTSGRLPAGKTVFYQKHMTHHLLPEVDRDALAGLRHAFLIRDPRRLLASYAKVRQAPTLSDLGLEQQVEIFRRFGGPVIDAADLATRPAPALKALCAALGIGFDEAMLSWPAGPRPTDGVWAPHWYANVWASTGFGTNREPEGVGRRPEGVGRRPEGAERQPGGTERRPEGAGRQPGGTERRPEGAEIGRGDAVRADADASRVELPPELEPLASRCQPFYAELSANRLII